MTLLELTVVILVLLSLISVLFVGAQAWKRGSDRTFCIMNIQRVQKAVRAYSNMSGYVPGENVTELRDQLVGVGKFMEAPPVCTAGGEYTYGEVLGTDVVPPIGQLYLKCSFNATRDHTPVSYSDW